MFIILFFSFRLCYWNALILTSLPVACRSSADLLQGGTNGSALQAQKGRTHPATPQPLPGRRRLATLCPKTTRQGWRWWNLGLILAIVFLLRMGTCTEHASVETLSVMVFTTASCYSLGAYQLFLTYSLTCGWDSYSFIAGRFFCIVWGLICNLICGVYRSATPWLLKIAAVGFHDLWGRSD